GKAASQPCQSSVNAGLRLRGQPTRVACRCSKASDSVGAGRTGIKRRGCGVGMRRWCNLIVIMGLGLAAAGCPKGQKEYNQGRKAETVADYDAALTYYQQALKADPQNANFRAKLNQTRFEAGEAHVKKGMELRKKGDLQGAASEFQR